MTSHRGPRSDAIDPHRTSYDARNALLSLSITSTVVALVFAGFYLFSSAAAKVPTGPAVTQPINSTPPPLLKTQPESGPTQDPATP